MSWYECMFVQEIHAGGGRRLSRGRRNIASKRLVDVWINDGAQLWTWTVWFGGSSGVASRNSEVSCDERIFARDGDSVVLECWTTAIAKTRVADFTSYFPIEAHTTRLDPRIRTPRDDGTGAADAVVPVHHQSGTHPLVELLGRNLHATHIFSRMCDRCLRHPTPRPRSFSCCEQIPKFLGSKLLTITILYWLS